jgi:hypothetical protein
MHQKFHKLILLIQSASKSYFKQYIYYMASLVDYSDSESETEEQQTHVSATEELASSTNSTESKTNKRPRPDDEDDHTGESSAAKFGSYDSSVQYNEAGEPIAKKQLSKAAQKQLGGRYLAYQGFVKRVAKAAEDNAAVAAAAVEGSSDSTAGDDTSAGASASAIESAPASSVAPTATTFPFQLPAGFAPLPPPTAAALAATSASASVPSGSAPTAVASGSFVPPTGLNPVAAFQNHLAAVTAGEATAANPFVLAAQAHAAIVQQQQQRDMFLRLQHQQMQSMAAVRLLVCVYRTWSTTSNLQAAQGPHASLLPSDAVGLGLDRVARRELGMELMSGRDPLVAWCT